MLDVPTRHLALVLGLIQQLLPHCAATAFGSRVSGWPAGGMDLLGGKFAAPHGSGRGNLQAIFTAAPVTCR